MAGWLASVGSLAPVPFFILHRPPLEGDGDAEVLYPCERTDWFHIRTKFEPAGPIPLENTHYDHKNACARWMHGSWARSRSLRIGSNSWNILSRIRRYKKVLKSRLIHLKPIKPPVCWLPVESFRTAVHPNISLRRNPWSAP
jgi:hypothetical protein